MKMFLVIDLIDEGFVTIDGRGNKVNWSEDDVEMGVSASL